MAKKKKRDSSSPLLNVSDGQRQRKMAKQQASVSNHTPQKNDDGKSIVSENRYSLLSDQDGTAMNTSELNGFGSSVQQVACSPQAPVKIKLLPLVVRGIALELLQKDMTAGKICATFKLTRIGIKIIVSTKSEYENVKTYLNNAKAEYFTHDIASEKPFKAVVRGLPNMATRDLIAELKDRYKLQPIAVFPISRRKLSNPFKDQIYLIHFAKGTVTMNALKAIRYISNIVVNWEPYRGSNRDVTQCLRCLNFGHGTRNCHITPTCENCAQSHLTSECPIEGATAYICANCGGPHRATDRNCEKREEYKQIRKEASSKHGRKPRRELQIVPSEFPPLLREETTRPQQPQPTTSFNWTSRHQITTPAIQVHQQQEQELPPKFSAAQLLQIFDEMTSKLQRCNTRMEQVKVLGEFIIQYGC